MQQVQTCLEPNIKCHPLCDCEICTSGDKLLTMKDNLRYWTPLSLASWLVGQSVGRTVYFESHF